MTIQKSKLQGNHGEELVARALQEQGFKILARNYTSRQGEIDIVAYKKNLIIFVEVKTRSANYFDLSEVITHRKQHNIINTAKQFIAKHDYENVSYRFDVALLEPNHDGILSISYLSDAFRENEI